MNVPEPLHTGLYVLAFAWGAVWGSFLNVVIWRLPRGENLAHPPSACPKCGERIRWYDNVPVLGWLWLRGKCRDCKNPISARYPFVELLVGLLGLALWYHIAHERLTADTLPQALAMFMLHFYFVATLVAITFIDLDLTIIPHKLSMPLIGWGLVTALLSPKTGVWASYYPAVDWVSSLLGFVAGFGLLFAVFGGYKLLRGIDGGGGGDLWLLGAIGANLGWMAIPFVLFASSMQGILAALAASLYDRLRGQESGGQESLLIKGAHTDEYWENHPVIGTHTGGETPAVPHDVPAVDEEDEAFMRMSVPFGPFLALAAIEYIFFGRAALSWATSGILP